MRKYDVIFKHGVITRTFPYPELNEEKEQTFIDELVREYMNPKTGDCVEEIIRKRDGVSVYKRANK